MEEGKWKKDMDECEFELRRALACASECWQEIYVMEDAMNLKYITATIISERMARTRGGKNEKTWIPKRSLEENKEGRKS